MSGGRRGLPGALRPLHHREFRLLSGGLGASLTGSGLWLVALAWQVIALGGGAAQLSLVSTLYAVGMIACVLVGGVAADRLPQRMVLLVSDSVRAVVTAVLAVLSLTGVISLWQLAVGGLVIGSAEGFFYPSFTALVPRLLGPEELLAANGLEQTLRPVAEQGIGPVVGGLLVAAFGPGSALLVSCLGYLTSAALLLSMRVLRAPAVTDRPSALADLRAGFGHVRRTPWLLSSLLFGTALVLLIMGPIEVLLPFAVQRMGSDARGYGLALAMFGVGGAVGAIAVSSRRLPRRYFTFMFLLWGFGTLPMALIGLSRQLWVTCVALLVVGAAFSAAMVVWGTLLQRRVPSHLLGRISSLDFFVSLALMPVSMALAGPASALIGLTSVYVVAAVGSAVAGVAFLYLPRLDRDELAHPLEVSAPVSAG